jgi:hypothetical protein
MRSDFDSIMPTMVRMVAMEQSIRELVDQLRAANGETGAGGTAGADSATDDDTGDEAMGPVQPSNGADAAAKGEKYGPPVDHTLPPSVAQAVAKAAAPIPAQEPPAASPPQSLTAGITADTNKAAISKAQAPNPPEPSAPAQTATQAERNNGTLRGVRIADHGAQTRIVVDMSDKAALPVTLGADGKSLTVDPSGMGWDGPARQALKDSRLVDGYKYENGRLVIALHRPVKIAAHSVLAPDGGAGWRTVIDLAPAS